MQTHYKDGTVGEPQPFDAKKMEETLKNSQVDHVKVFNMTPQEEWEYKRKLTQRPSRKWR